MKLQHIAVIFIIIMLPITLILSQYIQTQIDLVNIRNSYTTSLLNATHDAMTAYELNSMNNDYNEDANSKKRDVQASINTFFNSLSNNLGVPGYIDKYVEPYIPAIVFTGYDGYYIYAKTTETPRYTKQEVDEIKKDNPDSTIEEGDIKEGASVTDYNLKPYIYYSAQYRNRTGDIDVVINYTLDNYITVYGTLADGYYISESGYLIDSEKDVISTGESLKEDVVCKIKQGIKTDANDVYFTKKGCQYFYTYDFQNKTFDKIYYIDNNKDFYINGTPYKNSSISDDGIILGSDDTNIKVIGGKYLRNKGENDGMYFKITSAGYYSQINGNNIQFINDTNDATNSEVTYIINDISSIYNKNVSFKTDIQSDLETLSVNDMVVDNGGERKRLGEITDTNNPYYNLKSDDCIFTGNIEEKTSNFNNHKQDIIKISIQENLKSALANYSNGDITYKLPIFTEDDWQKIFSNITMVAFMQDLPVSNGTYNNYAIATSTGNKEYIPEDGIYFVVYNEAGKETTYHRITCPHLKEVKDNEDNRYNGYTIVGYKAMEFERNNVKIDNIPPHNYYPHEATACYDCIVSSNYSSLYDQNGNLRVTNTNLLEIYYSALARERVTQYKATKYLSSY